MQASHSKQLQATATIKANKAIARESTPVPANQRAERALSPLGSYSLGHFVSTLTGETIWSALTARPPTASQTSTTTVSVLETLQSGHLLHHPRNIKYQSDSPPHPSYRQTSTTSPSPAAALYSFNSFPSPPPSLLSNISAPASTIQLTSPVCFRTPSPRAFFKTRGFYEARRRIGRQPSCYSWRLLGGQQKYIVGSGVRQSKRGREIHYSPPEPGSSRESSSILVGRADLRNSAELRTLHLSSHGARRL